MNASKNPSWMIYGANGYTGELIAREAVRRGLKPVLAGRNPAIEKLARELGLESRIFALDSRAAERLEGMTTVLHCAGPFSATSRLMLDACLASRVHYLDITGEIEVFESVFERADELKRGGIAALPGAGFDVVPTDCLAAMLKRKLPDANQLKLAFRSEGRLSPGTAKSATEGIALGGRVRKDGKLVEVPIAARALDIDFKGNGRPSHSVLSPWGDVATAFHSTGIPDIEFYIATPKRAIASMRAAAKVLRNPAFRKLVQRLIARTIKGPSQEDRVSGHCWVWGEARNPAGSTVRLRMELPEGYHFTVLSALACVEKVAKGELAPGAWTPSSAFGADFVLAIPGVQTRVEVA